MYEAEYVKRLVCAANNKIANPDFLTPECLEYYRCCIASRHSRCRIPA